MQLIVEVSDNPPGNIVEGALDQFKITGQLINKIDQFTEKGSNLFAYPNPFSNDIIINYNLAFYSSSSIVLIKDLLGKIIYSQKLTEAAGQLHLGKNLSPGIYLVVIDNGNTTTIRKIVKE